MKRKKYYKFSEKQVANVIVAARGMSACPKANRFVKKIDKKYRLKKKAKR